MFISKFLFRFQLPNVPANTRKPVLTDLRYNDSPEEIRTSGLATLAEFLLVFLAARVWEKSDADFKKQGQEQQDSSAQGSHVQSDRHRISEHT